MFRVSMIFWFTEAVMAAVAVGLSSDASLYAVRLESAFCFIVARVWG